MLRRDRVGRQHRVQWGVDNSATAPPSEKTEKPFKMKGSVYSTLFELAAAASHIIKGPTCRGSRYTSKTMLFTVPPARVSEGLAP